MSRKKRVSHREQQRRRAQRDAAVGVVRLSDGDGGSLRAIPVGRSKSRLSPRSL